MIKEKAFICDIDNTILDITHRFHYLDGENTDWEAFLKEETMLKDTPIFETIELINFLNKKYPIIFITGRNEGTRRITCKQIEKHCNLVYKGYILLMRKDGDMSQDTVIKEQLYKEHVEPNYEIIGAFDDKTRVIELWRSLGIIGYHVGERATGDGF